MAFATARESGASFVNIDEKAPSAEHETKSAAGSKQSLAVAYYAYRLHAGDLVNGDGVALKDEDRQEPGQRRQAFYEQKPDPAINALALMAHQYLETDGGELDHLYMSAGEHAVDVLADHGLATHHGRGGSWTESGYHLLQLA